MQYAEIYYNRADEKIKFFRTLLFKDIYVKVLFFKIYLSLSLVICMC